MIAAVGTIALLLIIAALIAIGVMIKRATPRRQTSETPS
jgi:hypothetical protein